MRQHFFANCFFHGGTVEHVKTRGKQQKPKGKAKRATSKRSLFDVVFWLRAGVRHPTRHPTETQINLNMSPPTSTPVPFKTGPFKFHHRAFQNQGPESFTPLAPYPGPRDEHAFTIRSLSLGNHCLRLSGCPWASVKV